MILIIGIFFLIVIVIISILTIIYLQTYADAGSQCTDSNQCEGFCKAPYNAKVSEKVIGTCSKSKHTDCWDYIKGGIYMGTACI